MPGTNMTTNNLINTRDLDIEAPMMRAKRLKSLRGLACLSRDQMCDHGNINQHTLIGWENARFGGLTVSGAQKIIARVAEENVYCTLEWLLAGKDPGPSITQKPITAKLTQGNDGTAVKEECNEDTIISEEALYFMQKNSEAIYIIVSDNGMSPHYQPGDYIAGKRKFHDDIKNTIGLDCIVQTIDNQLYFRRVLSGSAPNKFSITCLNLNSNNDKTVLQDIELKFSAPILWHRRRELKK